MSAFQQDRRCWPALSRASLCNFTLTGGHVLWIIIFNTAIVLAAAHATWTNPCVAHGHMAGGIERCRRGFSLGSRSSAPQIRNPTRGRPRHTTPNPVHHVPRSRKDADKVCVRCLHARCT